MDSYSITNIVSALVWPIVVLVALIIFRHPLRELIGKVLKVKIKAGKFEFESIKSLSFEYMQPYVSPQVMESLKTHPNKLVLAPHKARVTILTLDIKGFTDKAEILDPSELSTLITDYMTQMVDIVFERGGTLNRLEGFFLLASWGDPIEWPNSADLACHAALGMVTAVQLLNDDLKAKALSPLRLRIGINSGYVIVGNLGTAQRFGYSVMGDSVDLSVRLSDLCKQYPTNVLISQSTYEELQDHFLTQSLGELQVKGQKDPVAIYALLSDMKNNKSD